MDLFDEPSWKFQVMQYCGLADALRILVVLRCPLWEAFCVAISARFRALWSPLPRALVLRARTFPRALVLRARAFPRAFRSLLALRCGSSLSLWLWYLVALWVFSRVFCI